MGGFKMSKKHHKKPVYDYTVPAAAPEFWKTEVNIDYFIETYGTNLDPHKAEMIADIENWKNYYLNNNPSAGEILDVVFLTHLADHIRNDELPEYVSFPVKEIYETCKKYNVAPPIITLDDEDPEE
jgi:hypothetical protein